MWIQEHHVSTLKLKISFQVVVNCASFPSFRWRNGEVLIEGTVHFNQHGPDVMTTTSRLPNQVQRRGTGIVIQVYLQRVFLTIVISPGPYVLQDEEEGIKEEEGWRRLAPTVVFGWLLPVSSHTVLRHRMSTRATLVLMSHGPVWPHSMLCSLNTH